MQQKVLLALVSLTSFACMAEERPIRVACVGDSITWGYAMTNRTAECYPAQLQRMLGDGYEVRNFGDPGAGVYLHRMDRERPKAWSLRHMNAPAHAFKPDIVVAGLGINDARAYLDECPEKGDPTLTPGTFRRQYVELLESFAADGRRPRFLVWTRLGPCGKGHRLKGSDAARRMEFELEAVAATVGAERIDMLTPLLGYVETEHFCADGIHPEGVAQRVIAKVTAKAIRDPATRVSRPLGEGVRGWISMPRPALTARDAIVDRLDFVRLGVPLGEDVRPTEVAFDFSVLKGRRECLAVDWKVADGFLLIDVSDGAKDGSRYLLDVARSKVSYVPVKVGRQERSVADMSFSDDDWAGRKRRPAVVNAPVPTDSDTLLSLRGEWDFAFREYDFAARIHSFHKLGTWPRERKVVVPGCWEAQGVGEPSDERISYTHPGKASVPLRAVANGSGWYRRMVTVPVHWKGRRVWLKTGGVRARGRFWVNDVPVARLDDFIGTWKYDVTDLVRPGATNKIVVEVSNYFPNRNAQLDTYSRWGGIWRDVELEATPSKVWIDDVSVRGNFETMQADVLVALGGDTNDVRVVTSVPSDLRPWSPETPNLYTARVDLVANDGSVLQTRYERFGIRKLEARGNRLYLNGKPFFVRGFGDDSVYPLTGLTPADREFHLKHLKAARQAGFNCVRTHTHTEIDEYFQAADEAGVLVQPEMSYLHDECEGFFSYDACRDAYEMHLQLGRHPSFAIYSCGNEGWLGEAADRKLYRFIRELDPDRLVINQDGGRDNTYGTADLKSGPMSVWERGAYEPGMPFVAHEYLNLTVKCDPRLEQDYTGVYCPPATVAARTKWLEARGLGAEWVELLQNAQHALQAHWQKNGLEQARLDPFCDGFCLWTLVDFIGRPQDDVTCSANGYLDPFWRPKKGGWSLDEFARFNSPVGVFVDTAADSANAPAALSWNRCLFDWPDAECYRYLDRERSVYVSGETMHLAFYVDNYGETPIEDAEVEWTFGEETGVRKLGDVALGGIRCAAAVDVTVPELASSKRIDLAFALKGTAGGRPFHILNGRPFWVFPRREPLRLRGVAVSDEYRAAFGGRYRGLLPLTSPDVRTVIARDGSPEEMAAFQTGKNVISLSGQSGERNNRLGWWFAGDQVGTAFKPHSVLRHVPYEPSLTPLFFRIVRRPIQLPIEGLDPKDVIAAGEGKDHAGLYLSEGRVVGGGRHIRISGLDVLSDTPEGTAVLDGALDCMESTSR